MATYTTNLNLKKPDLTDAASISDINSNMDILDDALAAVLPTVTSTDNGKFLRVVDGKWAKSAIANASGGSF